MTQFFNNQQLLTPPLHRAAYSDRTAWLMAEMSRLAYFKFEGDIHIDDVAEKIAKEKHPKSIKKLLQSILNEKQLSSEKAQQELDSFLNISEFTLLKTFNHNGTQAFLACSETYDMKVLAFRGTEANIQDIKTDLKTTTFELDNYTVHKGFYQAFNEVKDDIQQALLDAGNHHHPLYITGHSLGGALALLATKYLAANSLGACYTFGGPRVASSSFSDDIKTPIYRIVNAADLVPRVPPAYIPHLLISIFELIHIPVVSKFLVQQLHKIVGFRHHGDMRFLTACREDFIDLRLLQNPSIIDRAFRLGKRLMTNYKAGATDHFIKNYSDKLEAFAERRNGN